ncbi:MAG TPA: hypothetical protein VFF06_10575 [Polyangia bacterium]|nr:hypothetical protein [Polyangia bacterium]
MSPSRLPLLLAGLFVAGPAFGAPRGAALLPSLKPAGSPELRDRFHEAATRGLQQAGIEVIPAAEIRMRLGVSDEMMSCSGVGPCAARVGLLLRTDLLIASEIIVSGKDYSIKLRALDAAGRDVGHLDDSCDICTLNEADQAVTRAVAKLASQPRPAESRVVEQPPPPPPRVVEQPPPPPVTAPPPAVEKRGFPLKLVLGIAAGVVGIIGISVGAYLVSIDGNPTCDAMDPVHHCKEVYNTVGGGGALIALGIVSLAGAGTLLYFEFRPTPKTQARIGLVPTIGGGTLTLGGRF